MSEVLYTYQSTWKVNQKDCTKVLNTKMSKLQHAADSNDASWNYVFLKEVPAVWEALSFTQEEKCCKIYTFATWDTGVV